jgi:Family of unknown function (DUF5752)
MVANRLPTSFEFKSAVHLTRIEREHASTVRELLTGLRTCSEACIFQHMFRTLEEHHFLQEGFANDFAHWANTECGQPRLSERLSAVDVRQFTSLPDLRARLVGIVEEYLAGNPQIHVRPATAPFYFCSAETVVLPTEVFASNLAAFVRGLQTVNLHSIHYHFIEARLRSHLDSNDFSVWLRDEWNLEETAARINGIDIYASTLEDVRGQIVSILDPQNH